MTKAELYVKARLAGLSGKAAAREAGYKGAVPPNARDLWRRVKALKETPGLEQAVEVERCKVDVSATKILTALAAQRAWSKARALVKEVGASRKVDAPR